MDDLKECPTLPAPLYNGAWRRAVGLSAAFPLCAHVSTSTMFSVVPSYIIYSVDNVKVILKNKTTSSTYIRFAVASHMHLCKLWYYPQGSDLHVTLGRWNILFIPSRL